MTFLNPIWLWGLLGLTVPLAIHLLSRKESKIIRMGSLRHLQDSTTNQAMSIRLNERWLLLLRCMLIGITVLLLAGLKFPNAGQKQDHWLVIEPGLEPGILQSLADSLQAKGYAVRQLAAGFPAAGESTTDTISNYWWLAESANNQHHGRTVVLSRNKLTRFDGRRIMLPEHVTWLSPDDDSSAYDLFISSTGSDSAITRHATSSARLTAYENIKRQNDASNMPPLEVVIASDDQHKADQQVIVAALNAIKKKAAINLSYTIVTPSALRQVPDGNQLIWLSTQPQDTHHAVISIAQEEYPPTAPLFIRSHCDAPAGCWIITKELSFEIALQERLVYQLSSILFKRMDDTIAHGGSRLTMPESMTWSSRTDIQQTTSGTHKTTDASAPLAIILLVTLAGERWLAMKRNQ